MFEVRHSGRMSENRRMKRLLALPVLFFLLSAPAGARTVYRCVKNSTVSLSTAPEPGSKCEKKEIKDDSAKVPNLWGNLGAIKGTLYEGTLNGKTVYTTRKLPGFEPVLKFFVETPKNSPAHIGLGKVSKPRLNMYAAEFKAAARTHKVDDAFLRAIAHAESGFNPTATSPKGAQGLMQLMPATARELGVSNPYLSNDAINGGARMLKQLLTRYKGDYAKAAAAYNAGAGAVAKFGGIPPYRETLAYVEKVVALHASYRKAMKLPALKPELTAAQ